MVNIMGYRHKYWCFPNGSQTDNWLLLEVELQKSELIFAWKLFCGKWRFTDSELVTMGNAVINCGEPLYGLLDRLLEWDQWPNEADAIRFRSQVEAVVEALRQTAN